MFSEKLLTCTNSFNWCSKDIWVKWEAFKWRYLLSIRVFIITLNSVTDEMISILIFNSRCYALIEHAPVDGSGGLKVSRDGNYRLSDCPEQVKFGSDMWKISLVFRWTGAQKGTGANGDISLELLVPQKWFSYQNLQDFATKSVRTCL